MSYPLSAIRYRQSDDKRRTLSRPALDVNATVVVIDNTIHCREPQTHAVAFLFGGEKRLEDVWQIVFRDADACVCYRDGRMGFIRMVLTVNAKLSPSGMASMALKIRLMMHCCS